MISVVIELHRFITQPCCLFGFSALTYTLFDQDTTGSVPSTPDNNSDDSDDSDEEAMEVEEALPHRRLTEAVFEDAKEDPPALWETVETFRDREKIKAQKVVFLITESADAIVGALHADSAFWPGRITPTV